MTKEICAALPYDRVMHHDSESAMLMQTLNRRVNYRPESVSPWILFIEVMAIWTAAGARAAQDANNFASSPDRRPMDGCQLEVALAPYLDHIEIVISDWRALHAPLEAFRQKLPAALGKRVVDTMFLPELTNSSWSDYHSMAVTRHACFRLWLDRQRPHAGDRWLAIEQDGLLDAWPATERSHVILGTLAQPHVVHEVIERLKAQSGAPSTANAS